MTTNIALKYIYGRLNKISTGTESSNVHRKLRRYGKGAKLLQNVYSNL